MKSASFFILSVAFHAVILVFSVSSLKTGGEKMIPVILLGGDGGGGEGSAPRQHQGGARGTRAQELFGTGNMVETAKAGTQVPAIAPEFLAEGLMAAGFKGDEAGKVSAIEVAAGERGGGAGSGGGEHSQGGTGPGGASGGNGLPGLGFARAGYAYNPTPKYPETARREGWEGTVLLRVLVDQDGKSKSIEINRSSGFETLDRAAMQAVKSWRFYPAHYGERRVESWVNVPIVFNLADLRN